MREIKFRGKTKKGDWTYGFLSYSDNEETHYIGVQEIMTPVVSETVGQFTGLKDKNGVDIYEGDKLQYTDMDGKTYNGEIVYKNAAFDILGNWNEWLGEGYADECVITGNIHDK